MMRRALEVARRALDHGAMPIAAVLAVGDTVLGEAYWRGIRHGLLAHPEHEVLVAADRAGARLKEATLYTTLEPCLMCLGTAMSAFLPRIVFALTSPADGAADVVSRWTPALGHPQPGRGPYVVPRIQGGLCARESRALVLEWLTTASGVEAEFARVVVAAPTE